MSIKHPIIAVTGSSGAGTSTVLQSFKHIFRREKLTAHIIEGDSFHRYDRMAMRAMMKEQEALGNRHFSHFGPEANMLAELEQLFVSYGEKARDNKLTVEEMTGGTFTISNGGVFGSLLSTPIINPPQSAILGMHKIQDRPMAVDGQKK